MTDLHHLFKGYLRHLVHWRDGAALTAARLQERSGESESNAYAILSRLRDYEQIVRAPNGGTGYVLTEDGMKTLGFILDKGGLR